LDVLGDLPTSSCAVAGREPDPGTASNALGVVACVIVRQDASVIGLERVPRARAANSFLVVLLIVCANTIAAHLGRQSCASLLGH